MVKAVITEERYCRSCGHRCHCYTPRCTASVGVGMTDKDQQCECTKCDCGRFDLFSNLVASSEEK